MRVIEGLTSDLCIILYYSHPLVIPFNNYSACIGRCFSVQRFMWSHVVMVYLITFQNRAVFCLRPPEHLFPVSDFAVHPFHLIVVFVPSKMNVPYVFRSLPVFRKYRNTTLIIIRTLFSSILRMGADGWQGEAT